jgi:IS5 family transposase
MSKQQLSFVDVLLSSKSTSKSRLRALSGLVDWGPLGALARQVRPGKVGRKPYDALAMLKALYLASLYDLSDPQLEEALDDRRSFREFCGFSMMDALPDETTLCRFRLACAKAGVLEAAFAEVNRQLDARGLIVRKGSMLDATVIAAASRRPPLSAGSKPQLPQEPEASFTRKNNQNHFGYRLHLAADQGSGLIRRLVLTPAHINESLVADQLISGDERAVYADKGYENKERRRRLKAQGIKDRVMHRSHKNQPALPHWQQRRNRLIAKQRAPVEGIFGCFKRLYGRTRARYLGLARNTADFFRLATVFNLNRAIGLLQAR